MIIKKSPEEIELMAASGDILVQTLDLIGEKLKPGITTLELDNLADEFIRSKGATPAFKGYRGYPGSICTSPNSVVVHGIPGEYEVSNGDILSVDVGVDLDGWISDAARTFAVGNITPVAKKLLSTTEQSLLDAVEQCVPDNRVGAISNAVQTRVEEAGFSIIRSLVGHGVGQSMHEDPQVPNYGHPDRGPVLEEGMVLAVEPMVTVGGPGVKVAEDDWAVYSQDGSLAAHFEFTIAITGDGPRVLTPWNLAPAERQAAA